MTVHIGWSAIFFLSADVFPHGIVRRVDFSTSRCGGSDLSLTDPLVVILIGIVSSIAASTTAILVRILFLTPAMATMKTSNHFVVAIFDAGRMTQNSCDVFVFVILGGGLKGRSKSLSGAPNNVKC